MIGNDPTKLLPQWSETQLRGIRDLAPGNGFKDLVRF